MGHGRGLINLWLSLTTRREVLYQQVVPQLDVGLGKAQQFTAGVADGLLFGAGAVAATALVHAGDAAGPSGPA